MSELSSKRPVHSAEPDEKAAPMATPVSDAEAEIDLLELFFRLAESWKRICVTAILGAIVMGVVSFFVLTPQYEATSKLYVMNASDSAINLSDLQIGSYLTSDYREVFKTWEVHERVIQNLSLPYSYEQMQRLLSVSNPSDTRILYITAKTPDPQLSTDIANEYASVARQYISEIMSTEQPNVMSVALRPVKPVSPNKTLNILIGFVLGALLMTGVITIRFVMDDKIKTADDIAKYVDMPTLAIVPQASGGDAGGAAHRSRSSARPKRRKG